MNKPECPHIKYLVICSRWLLFIVSVALAIISIIKVATTKINEGMSHNDFANNTITTPIKEISKVSGVLRK